MNQDGREVHTWQVAAASVLTQLPNVFSQLLTPSDSRGGQSTDLP